MKDKKQIEHQLDQALDLILELTYDDPSFMCETIMENEDFCDAGTCENFNKTCLLRYLKYYKKEEK